MTISKPTGVRSISDDSATIVLNFGEAKQKTITIRGISYRNVPSGLVANLETPDDASINIQIIGVESVINAIDENSNAITAYVDLTSYSTGNYAVPVHVEGNDSRLQYVVTKNINIVLSNAK